MLMSVTMKAAWLAHQVVNHPWADPYDEDRKRKLEVCKAFCASQGIDLDARLARARKKRGFFTRLLGRGG